MKAILLAVLAAAPLHAAAPFDLVCRGTRAFHDPLAAKTLSFPYDAELRIDLAKGIYCYGACQRTRPIVAQMDQVVVLSRPDPTPGGQAPAESTTVDRAAGRLTSTVAGVYPDQSSSSITATCALAPFKGFPNSGAKY